MGLILVRSLYSVPEYGRLANEASLVLETTSQLAGEQGYEDR